MSSADILDQTPALEPPDGQSSNFVNPPSLYDYNVATGVICLIFTVTFFVIRVYTKFFLLKARFWDDYICALAMALFIAYVGLNLWVGSLGGGRHLWDITLPQFILLLQVANTIEVMYCVTIAVAKVSILLQLRRIFSTAKNSIVGIITTTLIWANVLFFAAAALAGIFACIPREAIWNIFEVGRCINTVNLIVSSSAINLVSDITILLLPIIYTWRLVLPLSRKIGVCIVFATGAFAVAAAILRLVSSIALYSTADVVYVLTEIALWTEAEIATVIVCGCMPVLPRFLKEFLPGQPKTSYAGASKYGDHNGAYGTGFRKGSERRASRVDMETGILEKQINDDKVAPMSWDNHGKTTAPRRVPHNPIRIQQAIEEDRITEARKADRSRTAVEIEDTSPPPQLPPKDGAYSPGRGGSASSGGAARQSQHILNAVTGRYERPPSGQNSIPSPETQRQRSESQSPRIAATPQISRDDANSKATKRQQIESRCLKAMVEIPAQKHHDSRNAKR